MRIGWCAPHPDLPTGYATQSALILPRLRDLGHDVAVFATAGQPGHPGHWNGIPVFPHTTYADAGEDVVTNHYAAWKADIVFTFLCTWFLEYPAVWRGLRTVHITPVDCSPMSWEDHARITNTGGMPAAISQFGLAQMRAGTEGRAKLDPLYLPHGVSLSTFTPNHDRDAMRADMGFKDKFVVGMNFHNNDKDRKNTDPAMRGFAKFHAKHPDSVLAIHAIQALKDGIVLPRLASHLGIMDAVTYSPQYQLVTGQITPPMLADWYNALDVYLGLGNEGFGLPHIEAQACGVPVILGNWSTGPELAGPGWLAEGQGFWNEKHRASWSIASVDSVADQLEHAYEDARNRREAARDFAVGYGINKIMREHWEPVLGELG